MYIIICALKMHMIVLNIIYSGWLENSHVTFLYVLRGSQYCWVEARRFGLSLNPGIVTFRNLLYVFFELWVIKVFDI